MSKKEKLMEVFADAFDSEYEFIAIAIETRGNAGLEIIINPKVNFETKLDYYCKSYNDDLVLNTYDGIRIVAAYGFESDSYFENIEYILNNDRL